MGRGLFLKNIMSIRLKEGFRRGFVETCIRHDCNADQSDILYKVAVAARVYDDMASKDATMDKEITMFGKAELINQKLAEKCPPQSQKKK
jgi:hypothetical protein